MSEQVFLEACPDCGCAIFDFPKHECDPGELEIMAAIKRRWAVDGAKAAIIEAAREYVGADIDTEGAKYDALVAAVEALHKANST